MTQRQPAGIPTGGQFAAHDRADATTTLSRPLGEVRRDFMQLRHTADDLRFRLSSHAALLTVNTIKEIAPDAATVVFEHRYDDDSLRVSALRDDDGNELNGDVLNEASRATADYLASIALEDNFLLGQNDEDQDGYDRVYKTVSLRGTSFSAQSDMQKQLNLDLASAGVNAQDIMVPILDHLILEFQQDDNQAAVEAAFTLDSNDVVEVLDRHISPAVDGIRREIVERAQAAGE